MSGVVISRAVAFEMRICRKLGFMTRELAVRLQALFKAYDPLEFRAGCARAGFRLSSSVTSFGGKVCRHLVHRRAA